MHLGGDHKSFASEERLKLGHSLGGDSKDVRAGEVEGAVSLFDRSHSVSNSAKPKDDALALSLSSFLQVVQSFGHYVFRTVDHHFSLLLSAKRSRVE
jgi:hypothetical protein